MKHHYRLNTLVLAMAAALSLAQAPALAASQTGTVAGSISGQAGAEIEIRNNQTGFRKTMLLDQSGNFRFPQLEIGEYELSIRRDGKVLGQQQVRVTIGSTTQARFSLGSDSNIERIQVAGGRISAIDLTSSDSGLVIGEVEFDRLPVGRDLTSIALLAPGTVKGDAQFGNLASFSGSSVAENVCYINGMNVTDPDKGLGCGSVPFEFYKEFQVKTGGYSAQYGRATGGVINAVTKSGSNEFEFGATAYYSPDYLGDGSQITNLAGSVFKDTTGNKERSMDASFSVGGPILEDQLFFFALINPKKKDLSFSSSTSPRTGGPSHFNEQTEKSFFWGLKLDWQINDRNRLSYLGFSDARDIDRMRQNLSYNNGVEVKGTARPVTLENGGDTHTLNYVANFTDDFTASAMIGRFKTDASTYPTDSTCSTIGDTRNVPTRATQYACGPGINNDFNQLQRDAFRVDFEWSLPNDHLVRFGYDRENIEANHITNRAGGYNVNYSTLGVGAALGGTTFVNTTGAPLDIVRQRVFDGGGKFSTDNYAIYLEDNWTINEQWFLTAGIRSDVAENKGKTGVTFVKLDNQIAPRLGLTYDPMGDGSSKVFANYGQYFFPVPVNTNFRAASGIVDKSDYFTFTGVDTSNGRPLGTSLIGSTVNSSGAINEPGLSAAPEYSAQSVVEYILGYQHELNENYTALIRAQYRTTDNMGDDYCDVEVDPSGGGNICTLFNPGKGHTFGQDTDYDGIIDPGSLHYYTAEQIGVPKGKRDYGALQLELTHHSEQLNWTAQYTWSHSYGNNEGGVNSDNGQTDTGVSSYLDFKASSIGANGNLPNDRRHIFKFYGSYSLTDSWAVGWNSSLLDGRPMSAMGLSFPADHPYITPGYGDTYYRLVDGKYVFTPRGGMGRQPWVYNLDLSVSYSFSIDSFEGRASLDVFNVLDTQQSLTKADQTESQGGTPNQFYGLTQSIQTPRQIRLGISVNF
ncbi:MAG: TonB-dependent receptor [Gammaproteobacteria bacterium]|nr:TonB-dependent receptor [Gammaproteobacteria bacterium]